jgi:hypothetical protein
MTFKSTKQDGRAARSGENSSIGQPRTRRKLASAAS